MTEITEEDFKEYERVRKGGLTNMTQFSKVAQLSDLTEDQAREIVVNYDEYAEEYPEVRN